VDRRFTVKGAGTVVTGTLPAGTLARGDLLGIGAGGSVVRVRGVQSLGAPVDRATGVARVALNVTGDDLEDLDRGSVLVTPEAYLAGGVIDVRVTGAVDRLPEGPLLHVGATATAVHVRPLGGDAVRLVLDTPLPLRVGDRALLRDPGSREVWGVRVLDPLPPSLRRRGAGARRAKELAGVSGEPDLRSEVERRGFVEVPTLRRLGVPASPVPSTVVAAGGWLMSADRADQAADQIPAVVAAHDRAHPLDPGLPLAVVAERVGLPSPDLAAGVVRPPLRLAGGRVLAGSGTALPPDLERALTVLAAELAEAPFAAPTADRLRELGLDTRRIAAAAKADRLLRLAPGIVLLPGAVEVAVEWLRELPQPFTTSEARVRLGTSRRVVLPLLEHLDRAGLTRRLPDDRRAVAG